jgi:hypothetical protein
MYTYVDIKTNMQPNVHSMHTDTARTAHAMVTSTSDNTTTSSIRSNDTMDTSNCTLETTDLSYSPVPDIINRAFLYNRPFTENFDRRDSTFFSSQYHHMSLMDFVVSPPGCG